MQWALWSSTTPLAEQQPAPFSALLHLPDDEVVLSFSPELFFSIDNDQTITMRPMKGTAPLGDHLETQIEWLAADEKNRAETLDDCRPASKTISDASALRAASASILSSRSSSTAHSCR